MPRILNVQVPDEKRVVIGLTYIKGVGLSRSKLICKELNIQDEVLKEDKEMIEDLVISAVNKGITIAQAKSKEKMDSVTGGMLSGLNIPGI